MATVEVLTSKLVVSADRGDAAGRPMLSNRDLAARRAGGTLPRCTSTDPTVWRSTRPWAASVSAAAPGASSS
jgi:hypothetical protein